MTGKKVWTWFAINDERPLFAFAGIFCTWHGTRGTQKAPEQGEQLLYGFLTTEANGVVAPVHAKAMPVILRTAEECDAWLTADPAEALKMQRPPPDDALKIVARGEKEDRRQVRLLVKSLYAAARCAVLAGDGDVEGAAVWHQITAAVEELRRERRPGEALN